MGNPDVFYQEVLNEYMRIIENEKTALAFEGLPLHEKEEIVVNNFKNTVSEGYYMGIATSNILTDVFQSGSTDQLNAAIGGLCSVEDLFSIRRPKEWENVMKEIKIIYHDDTMEHISPFQNGDWIDLRASKDYKLKKGEFALIDLGVSMKLPEGYEANIVPRSSTFKNFHVVQTNHFGVIDNSYSGTNDIWKFPAMAVEDTEIKKNDRICQFRIVEKMPDIKFVEVEELDECDRGGFGSTGKN